MNRSEPQNEKRAFLVALVFFAAAFLVLMRPFIVPVVLAAIIAILLYPVYHFILKSLGRRRYLASFLATFLVFLTLVLPTGLILALLVNQAVGIVSNLNFQETISLLNSQTLYQEYIIPLSARIEQAFNIKLDLPQLISKMVRDSVGYITNFSPQVLGQTASFLFSFFVMHVSLFFFFIEGPEVTQVLLDLSPLKKQYENHLVMEFKNMIYATVYGYLVTALLQAVLAWVGFQIAGVQAPLVFATLTFFMSLVPIVGATAVWLPVSIWFFLHGNTPWAVFLFLYGAFLISGIDNIIKPLIMRGKANVHILLIFFSLLGGIRLFGPIGILFGPVITAFFLACLRLYRRDFVQPNER